MLEELRLRPLDDYRVFDIGCTMPCDRVRHYVVCVALDRRGVVLSADEDDWVADSELCSQQAPWN
jgi:hypothetical protein